MWNGIGWYGFIGPTTSTTDISLGLRLSLVKSGSSCRLSNLLRDPIEHFRQGSLFEFRIRVFHKTQSSNDSLDQSNTDVQSDLDLHLSHTIEMLFTYFAPCIGLSPRHI